jgi:hypothetical protein
MGHSGHGRMGGLERLADGAAGEELAYARARFAVDPATPSLLADAWQAPTGAIEEDESELIDAVADCLSVGLPLDAAVASWRSGSLQVPGEGESRDDSEDSEDDDTNVFGEENTSVFARRSGRTLVR